jgi:hypothetical protein
MKKRRPQSAAGKRQPDPSGCAGYIRLRQQPVKRFSQNFSATDVQDRAGRKRARERHISINLTIALHWSQQKP